MQSPKVISLKAPANGKSGKNHFSKAAISERVEKSPLKKLMGTLGIKNQGVEGDTNSHIASPPA